MRKLILSALMMAGWRWLTNPGNSETKSEPARAKAPAKRKAPGKRSRSTASAS